MYIKVEPDIIIAAIAVAVAWFQLSNLKKSVASQVLWNQRENSLSYSLGKHSNLLAARKTLEQKYKIFTRNKPLDDREVNEIINNAELYDSVLAFLGHWENLALAIREEIADEKVAYDMVGTGLTKNVKLFEKFIEYRKRHDNPRAYDNLHGLIIKWQNK